MATSHPNPYQSRFIKTVIRQTRQWIDRGQTTLQQIKTAASWSAQILLYPIYAFFQTSRLIGQKVDQTVQAYSLGLEADTLEDAQIPLKVQTTPLTADSPIQNVLEAVRSLAIPGDVPVLAKAPDIKIRAIASLIEQKSLVLVTNHNQVLDVLTLEQQQILHKQIIVAIAVYARQIRACRLQPKWTNRLLQGVRDFVQPLLPAKTSRGFARLLPAPEQGDPIRTALEEVQRLLKLSELSEFPALPASDSNLAIQESLQPLPPVHIRGVVSLLPERSLALVTNENTVLEILSPEQQQFLNQRIAWEVAHYLRYMRLRSQAEGLLPVRPPHQFSRLFAPVWGFQWLMTWMQSGVIALSTNLFKEASKEASYDACPLPLPPSPTAPSTNLSPNIFRQLLRSLTTLILPSYPSTPTNVLYDGQLTQPSGEQSKREIEAMTANAYSSTNAAAIAAVESFSISNSPSPDYADYVDTDATLMGYEQSWLERVLHWLDQCFFWIEEWLGLIWKRLKGN